jgi:hypothetical protein
VCACCMLSMPSALPQLTVCTLHLPVLFLRPSFVPLSSLGRTPLCTHSFHLGTLLHHTTPNAPVFSTLHFPAHPLCERIFALPFHLNTDARPASLVLSSDDLASCIRQHMPYLTYFGTSFYRPFWLPCQTIRQP